VRGAGVDIVTFGYVSYVNNERQYIASTLHRYQNTTHNAVRAHPFEEYSMFQEFQNLK